MIESVQCNPDVNHDLAIKVGDIILKFHAHDIIDVVQIQREQLNFSSANSNFATQTPGVLLDSPES